MSRLKGAGATLLSSVGAHVIDRNPFFRITVNGTEDVDFLGSESLIWPEAESRIDRSENAVVETMLNDFDHVLSRKIATHMPDRAARQCYSQVRVCLDSLSLQFDASGPQPRTKSLKAAISPVQEFKLRHDSGLRN